MLTRREGLAPQTRRSWWRRVTVSVRSGAATVVTAALCLLASAARAADIPLNGCPNRAVRITGTLVQLIDTSTNTVIFSDATSGHVRVEVSQYCCVYAIIDSTGTIKVRKGENGASLTTTSPTSPNSTVTFSGSWCGYAIITPGGSVIVFNVETLTIISTTNGVTGKIHVDFGPLGKLYALIDSVSITVFAGPDGRFVSKTTGTTPDSYVIWSPDCTQFAIVTPGVGITVIDAATGHVVGQGGANDDIEWDPPCGFHFTPRNVDLPMAPPWLLALGLGAAGAAWLGRRRGKLGASRR